VVLDALRRIHDFSMDRIIGVTSVRADA